MPPSTFTFTLSRWASFYFNDRVNIQCCSTRMQVLFSPFILRKERVFWSGRSGGGLWLCSGQPQSQWFVVLVLACLENFFLPLSTLLFLTVLKLTLAKPDQNCTWHLVVTCARGFHGIALHAIICSALFIRCFTLNCYTRTGFHTAAAT